MRFALLLLSFVYIISGCRRSVHRPSSACLPEIETSWKDEKGPLYRLKNSHLEPTLFQTYDPQHVLANELPDILTCRNNTEKTIPRAELIEKLDRVIQALQTTNKKIKHFDDFTILKQRDFNYRTQTGLMVLRYKEYPFVVKLFIEKPRTLAQPFGKGVEECAFFIMGGGMNRFLAGFTRVKNREYITAKIATNRYWSSILDVPRKWYWVPPSARPIIITGHRIGTCEQSITVPHIYAIFCDAIDVERTFSLTNREDRFIAISVTEFLGLCIDPHINNFVVEKDTQKIIIIDTEHFPTMVGIKESFKINDFLTYYVRLFCKCMRKKLTLDKQARLNLQTNPKPLHFPYE